MSVRNSQFYRSQFLSGMLVCSQFAILSFAIPKRYALPPPRRTQFAIKWFAINFSYLTNTLKNRTSLSNCSMRFSYCSMSLSGRLIWLIPMLPSCVQLLKIFLWSKPKASMGSTPKIVEISFKRLMVNWVSPVSILK